jgi:uncharacterized protein YdhG (YjbR/CyaY superfamily)
MKIDAADVSEYLDKAPLDRRPALSLLRELCLKILKGYTEALEYSMPSYARGGTVEVAFASQKQYLSLYILKTDVVEANRDRLQGLNVGKGCIRYKKPEQIDFAVVETLLQQTVESGKSVC